MKIDDLRTLWRGYSPHKEWINGGLAATVFAAAGSGHDGYRSDDGQRMLGAGMRPEHYAGSTGCSPDIIGDWKRRGRSGNQSARNFDEMMRGQTDVQDTRTGEIIADAPNQIADPVGESGTCTVVPPALAKAPAAPADN